jgi:RsiW-degrading membrane proteinase PrsW (M82 family)
MTLHLAATGALPALLAMWYVDRLDSKRPEPKKTLRKITLFGVLSVIPAIILELIVNLGAPPAYTYGHALYTSFVMAAGVEELCKVLVVVWFVWKLPEFDERMDGIVYATRAGLGFAAVENILYLLSAETTEGFIYMYVARALLAVPGHAIWAGLMGYFAAKKKFDGTGPGILGGYLIAVALHGGYDATVFMVAPLTLDGYTISMYAVFGALAVQIGLSGLWLRSLARRAIEADDLAEANAVGVAEAQAIGTTEPT